jgi:hypothetical protein
VLLAICSEGDAFVAASLREFSLTARFAPLPFTFTVAVVCAMLVGRVLLRPTSRPEACC